MSLGRHMQVCTASYQTHPPIPATALLDAVNMKTLASGEPGLRARRMSYESTIKGYRWNMGRRICRPGANVAAVRVTGGTQPPQEVAPGIGEVSHNNWPGIHQRVACAYREG